MMTESFWISLSDGPVSPGHQSGDDLIQAVPEHTIGYSTIPLRAEEGVASIPGCRERPTIEGAGVEAKEGVKL